LSDFNDISYVGRLWCPEMIPDIEQFLPVAIFKMAATIPYKFNIVRFQRPQTTGLKNKLKATFEIEQCWIFPVLWWPFWKWRPVEIFQCQESIEDVEIEQCWICTVLWRPFWKWRPVMIPDIEKFLRVAIFKMAATIPQKFDIVRYHQNLIIFMISDNVEFLPPIFLYRILAAILKMADISKILKTQNCSSNGDLSLCQILCLSRYSGIKKSYDKTAA
jgi:hypothetical protein